MRAGGARRCIDSNCGFLSEIALYCSDCGIEIPPNRELTTPSNITVCQTCFQKRLSTGASRVSEVIVKQSFPNTLGTRLLLPKDEPIRFFSIALRFLPTEGYNKQTQAKAILNSKSRGWFLLTHRRVIYLQRKYAPAFAGGDFEDFGFDIPLERITGIVPVLENLRYGRWAWSKESHRGLEIYEGKKQRTVYLELERTAATIHPQSDGTLIGVLVQGLALAIVNLREQKMDELQRRLAEAQKAANKAPTQIIMDFSWLREYMEKGGVLMRSTKCPSCGGKIEIPSHGEKVQCEYCGTIMVAEDIFKKIKDLAS